ncbi:hypothetical protein MCGE09_00226 [Thaumarchaeota archaeon SCGC AB-539-E09]|nr:hypothetical protein MCGE09_00226 [Thaumarchaeota archaeon SCGC AB-539-E09]
MFTRRFLASVRVRAIRNHVWFKVLDHQERGIFRLSSILFDKIKSVTLGVVLMKIVKKIRDSLKSEFSTKLGSFGPSIAKKLSELAVTWGNSAARNWSNDLNFAKYLTLLNMSNPFNDNNQFKAVFLI